MTISLGPDILLKILCKFTVIAISIVCIVPEIVLSQDNRDRLSWHGQIRSGYYFNEVTDRTGLAESEHEWRTRIQLGLEYKLHSNLDFRARYAGRYSTIQDRFRFTLDDHTAGSTGIRLGESTLDEINLTWRPAENLWVRGGRFQLSFPLRGVLSKGLNRYDSPNTSVAFTDGMWMRWSFHNNWNIHLVTEYNSPSGSSSAARAPLRFDQSESRFSFWSMLQHRDTAGKWAQREFSINYLPKSFEKDGEFRDYLVFTTRLVLRIPEILTWADISVGLEGGYIPSAPEPAAFANNDLRKDAIGWQAALNFQNIDFLNYRHNFGVLYAQADPGWLISPSFIPNSETYEVRYQLRLNPKTSFEIRYRYRPELIIPVPFENAGKISDLYARVTFRI